jgi:hypothetical protein
MTKTKNVTNEPNFKTSRPKGIRTFALSPLPFAMVSPNEPNFPKLEAGGREQLTFNR